MLLKLGVKHIRGVKIASAKAGYKLLTHVLLIPDIPCFANSVDPDQLAS